MIVKIVFTILIFAIPIFGFLPFSSGIQSKNHFLKKPLTFPKQTSNDCATQNQQLRDFAKDVFKKLGIIAKAYQPKGNHPKINEKMKKGMFQECKHLISEKEKRKNIDCSIQNHQLKEFARELLKGKAISSNPFKFNLKCFFLSRSSCGPG